SIRHSMWTRVITERIEAMSKEYHTPSGFYLHTIFAGVSYDIGANGEPLEQLSMSTRVQVSNLPPLILPAMLNDFIYVHVENTDGLFVTLLKNRFILMRIAHLITNLVADKPLEMAFDPAPGEVVLLRSLTNMYVRGIVVSKPAFMKVEVYSVDDGRMLMVSMNDVFLLHDEELLSTPPQAFPIQVETTADMRDIDLQKLKVFLGKRLVGYQMTGVTEDGKNFMGRMFFEENGSDLVYELSQALCSRTMRVQLMKEGSEAKGVFRSRNSSSQPTICRKSHNGVPCFDDSLSLPKLFSL
uniref:Tudor domain-containing protein n=1 Tax=Parascaris univalens TaxID=6257 RepID=A0A915AYH7_PARUN